MRTAPKLVLLSVLATVVAWGSIASANTVVFKGNTHTSIGAATLTVFGTDSLVVSGLGGGGADGVSIAMPALAAGQDLDISSPTLVRAVPVGAFLETKAIGTVNAVPASLVSTYRTTRNAAGTLHKTIDLSPSGASVVSVTAFKNGIAQQAQDLSGSSFTGDATIGAVSGITIDTWDVGIIPPSFSLDGTFATQSVTDGAVTMSVAGPGNVQFLFRPKATNAITALSALETRGGGGLTSFTITNEVIETTSSAVPALDSRGLLVLTLLLLAASMYFVLRNRRAQA